MFKKLIFCLLVTVWGSTAIGQQVVQSLDTMKQKVSSVLEQLDKGIKANYNRPGVTVILLSDPRSPYRIQIERAFNQLTLPSRFDANPIQTKIIERPESFSLANTSKVTELLESKRVTKQILGAIFNENTKGQYDYQRLLQRARLNLDDNAFNKLERSNQGVEGNLKTDDWILPLVENTYINVLTVRDVMRWSDYYDQRDVAERELARRQKREPRYERRTNRGYKMDVQAVLLKVNLKDSVIYNFYENFWVDQYTKPEVAKAHLAARENLTIPLSKLSSYSPLGLNGFGNPFYDVSSVETGVAMLYNNSLDDAVSSVSELKVKQIVYDIRPIKAKIGTKEGLSPDDLYTVYENIQTADGTVYAAYRGLVRASVNVTDNSAGVNGSTEPTRFYQVAGEKIEQGMIMEQANDLGIAVSMTGVAGGVGYLGFRGELLAKGFGQKSRFWDNTRLYLDFGISGYSFRDGFDKLSVVKSDSGSVVGRWTDVQTGATLFTLGLGFQKYFNLLRGLQIGPYAGFRGDWAIFSNEDLHKASQRAFNDIYGFKGITIDLGIRASVSLRKQFRVYAGFGIVPFFTNSAIFGVNKRLTESTRVQDQIRFTNADQSQKYQDSNQSNPFYLPYSLYRSEFGIQFEF